MIFLKLQNGSDIRGVACGGVEGESVNLTEDVARAIGAAFVKWLEKHSVAGVSTSGTRSFERPVEAPTIGIGCDSRITGEKLLNAVAEGVLSAGAKVVNCGLSTTPAMFMSTVFPETKYTASIMITASHLPFNRNGIKFFTEKGGLEKEDITEILKIAGGLEQGGFDRLSHPASVPEPVEGVEVSDASFEKRGDFLDLYAEHLKTAIKNECGDVLTNDVASKIKIVVDAGNGAGGFFVEKVLASLGFNTDGSQFLEPDGMFPNHIPNPENKAAMESIKNAVLKNGADLGLIFDTDVDRMSCVFSNGEEVNRDSIIALVSAILTLDGKNKGATIVTDSVTSNRLTKFLEKELGLKHLCYMRGYKNVINKQIELNESGVNCPLAMETSGHGALKENYFLDDGAFLAVKIVSALVKMKSKGKELSSLIEKLEPLVEEEEVRLKLDESDFKAQGKRILEQFKARASEKGYEIAPGFEGVRLNFDGASMVRQGLSKLRVPLVETSPTAGSATEIPKGWILLRMSLHDPVMPMNFEAERKGDLAKLKAIADELLSSTVNS